MTLMTKLSRLLLASALLGSAALPAMAQTGAGVSVTTPPAAATGTVGAQRPAAAPSGATASGAISAAPATQAAKPAIPAAPHAVTKAPSAGTTRTN